MKRSNQRSAANMRANHHGVLSICRRDTKVRHKLSIVVRACLPCSCRRLPSFLPIRDDMQRFTRLKEPKQDRSLSSSRFSLRDPYFGLTVTLSPRCYLERIGELVARRKLLWSSFTNRRKRETP